MVSLLKESKLNALERAGVGNDLAKLGDPRFREDFSIYPLMRCWDL